jgi:hypothetical protein
MIGEFLAAMRLHLPEDARVMLCQFRGDPNADIKGKWRAYVLNDERMVDEGANVYLCVSAMRKNARGEFRRRKENFAGGLLLMIDDLGSGPAAKFPLSTIDALPPTALVETSPDNFQAIYMFNSLITDEREFEALIKAFIDAQFLGKDTGMAGVNRVFRPPAGINGKPKHNKWRVRLAQWSPDHRYSIAEIAQAFGLDLTRAGPRVPRGATAGKSDNIRAFVAVRQALRSAQMLKKEEPDLAGWADVRCPWTAEHTGAIDNGAAIKLPDADNAWFGAFKCHHGACEGKGWRELTQWLTEEQSEILEFTNRNAKRWQDYRLPPKK